MKKFLAIVCVLAMAVSCLFVLASCGATPNSDPAVAKAALEEAGYIVFDATTQYSYLDGIESVIMGEYIDADLSDLESLEDLTDIDLEAVVIFYFESEAAATAAFEEIKAESQEATEEVTIDVCEQSGAMVYFGTSAGVKAAK